MTTTQLAVCDYIEKLDVLGYSDIKLNLAGMTVEVNGKPLDDFVLSTICARMRAEGFANRQALEDVIRMDAAAHPYHPIKTYLGTCVMTYDGGQHIDALASYFIDATKPYPMFATWLRKWLIGCCAKAMADRERGEQNAMLVLDGKQGIGKSTFCLWLCSGIPQFFIESPISTRNNDVWLRLGSFWLWEVGELGSTTRANDVEALKNFISTRLVTARRPWGRLDTRCPSLASLVGTVNNSSGFLADPTGSRRFLCSTIDAINWDYATEVNVNQVWGEAFAAYSRGEDWTATPEEMKVSSEINEQFEVQDVLDGYVQRYFSFSNTLAWTSSADLVAKLQEAGYRAGSTRALAMDLAATMKKRGIERKKHNNVWGYLGVNLPTFQPSNQL